MEILVADRLPTRQCADLAERDHAVRIEPELTERELPAAVGDAEVLVVRSTRVTAETLAQGPSLRAVVRAGSGTNTIDVAAASARGVRVCNVPGMNAAAVAELTLGLLLALDRRLPDAIDDTRSGRWRKAHYAQAAGLKGRALGIVGLGAVGMAVAERAAAFGLALFGINRPGRDPTTTARCHHLGMQLLPDTDELAERCDALTFHVPSDAGTRGLIGRPLLARVPHGAFLVNTSRGDLVDTEALIEAMDRKGVRAALDVFDHEPGESDTDFAHPLARHPNVYATPHIGASTEQAQQAVADGVVAVIDGLVDGYPRHCVNADTAATARAHASALTS